VGVLIALFERAVGFYATLIHINAYHQPGVQAGKEAADVVLVLQGRIQKHLADRAALPEPAPETAAQIAEALGRPEATETVFKICEHLAANPGRGIARSGGRGAVGALYGPTPGAKAAG
jgi:glucose-6-phosphate isomerase